MALVTAMVAAVAAAEALLLVVVTLPLARAARGLVVRVMLPLLQPLLFVVPLAGMQLLDVYYKHMANKLECQGEYCTSADRDRQKKSEFKNQRNTLLGLAVIVLYWALWRVCMLQALALRLEKQVEKQQKQLLLHQQQQQQRAEHVAGEKVERPIGDSTASAAPSTTSSKED